ncbi:cytochrome c biogenesis CcdA family protein [Methanocella arvoryzae]|uniref:Cytochrome c biogenesis protein n=1 Tax=Methanocella arvoryzae (strain DSM 22066 / NBRC 105507 / MRE50) TaxID=351160 RepID=Q0W8S2_METAR|nr:cytochrome c biogenesis CcdA family protein [Methanocella arvoryzae]CAJ35221.1 putative cytochrome c biogenesis protein [Methanocella arvoryzae MRE50]
METVLFGTAVLAGVASIMSPCVLPLLPGVMAYSTEKSKLTPLAIVFGLAISFTAMGVASAMIGSILFTYMDYIKIVSGAMIVIMGLYLLSMTVEHALLSLWQRLPLSRTQLPSAEEGGLLGGMLLGVSLGIVWIPCIGPILASILLIVAQEGTIAYGAFLLMAYSLGLAIPMLVVAYSSNFIGDKIRSVSHHTRLVRRVAGVILVAVGLYYIANVFGFSLGLGF